MASNEKTFVDSNRQYEPLDSLQIKVTSINGIEATVSGIHIGFMETRYYVHFKLPPINPCNGEELTAEEEEWLEYMIFLEEDLHWLLQLPHHRFWSQIVYDEKVHRCLESYLSQAPRDYDIEHLNLKEELYTALKKVHKLVFLVYLRMSTYKESKKHHIKPEAFGEIIYDNFIFDIPKIMDLCALYGIKNSSILSKMVQNIFSTQPKYTDDLDETTKDILTKAFNSFEEELLNICSGRSYSSSRGEKSDLLSYCDLVNYITDVSVTIHTFLSNYPPACEVFHQNGVLLRIPTFYEQVFPTIEKEITRNESIKKESLLENIKRKLILSKTSFLKAFRDVLNYTCIQNILNYKMSNKDEKICAATLVENYFEILTELIFNKNFICDYNLLYPFEGDLELFSELGINVDSEKVNFIFFTIHDTEDLPTETFTSTAVNGARPKVKNKEESVQKPATNIQDLADILRDKKEEENSCAANDSSLVCTPPKPSDVEIDSLIQSVLDLLPNYGEGFIEKCLDHYAYDKDKVIDALLTQELPNDIVCLDQNMKRQLNGVQDSYSVLSERKNIFDNDEFDVFSGNNINMKNIHMGKKNKTPTAYESLQNDTESEFLKQLTIAAGDEFESEFETQANLYEDEYDDTYDSTMVGLKEPAIEDVPAEESSDDSENEEDGRRKPKPLDFCIDPQILREKREQRMQARAGFHNRSRGNSRPTDDSHSRQQKDRHKSQVSNHNRRKQSDFKKSRGMYQ